MGERSGMLLTDLYQLTMLDAYRAQGMAETAVFEFFVRTLPRRRGFLMAAGLELVVDFLETMRFEAGELDYLRRSERFSEDFLAYLAEFRFTGDVDAMAEGTIFFADEPIIRVTAPLPEAQLAETRIINLLHFQSLIAAKAARMVLAAPGKTLVDFGLRRAHGAEAGLLAARASFVAGFDGTAMVLAGSRFGIPIHGTMAHSFIQAHDDEIAAFEHFARARPRGLTLLIDTYDTERAAEAVARLAPRLAADGIAIDAVRLDSGDLAAHSVRVRAILDRAGLANTAIFASGGLDEDALAALMRARAPIDGFGIGTSLTTSSDCPALDCAYKLQEYAGIPRRKRSEGKTTWPGRKQVWRQSADGRMCRDVVSIEGDAQAGETLVEPVMRGGRRIGPTPSLAAIRERAARNLAALPEDLARLDAEAPAYPVEIAPPLRALAAAVDRHLSRDGSVR